MTFMHVKRILVPIDFSEQSRLALREAAVLARERAASLTLLHVHAITEVAMLEFYYVEPPEKVAQVVEAAERQMQAWADEEKLARGHYEVRVVTGGPVKEILKAAEDHDVIVMGTHGRSGITHFLLGSVAERVIQAAHCSVLVVKSGKRR